MPNPSLQTLMDRVTQAQQRLTEAQDRLSDRRDKAVRAHDRVHELRRQRILGRGQPGVPTEQQVQDAMAERDTAMTDLQAVESDLGVQDAGPQS